MPSSSVGAAEVLESAPAVQSPPSGQERAARAALQPARPPARAAEDDAGGYGLEAAQISMDRIALAAGPGPTAQWAQSTHPASAHPAAPRLVCPSCAATLPPGSVICVPCGINVKTARPIITAEQGDTAQVYARAHSIIWFLSWLLALGMYPISSEAHGAKRPIAIRVIALLAVVFTVWFWCYEWSGSPRMQTLKGQLLWAGSGEPDPDLIEEMYLYTSYGDASAFEVKKRELRGSVPEWELPVAAMEALPPPQRVMGTFHPWQLISHAFLHGDPLHLAGNLLFLLIFGARINALIGNVGAVILFPLLGVAAAAAEIASLADQPPTAMLGASGAIMGLAGMYFIFFPVNKVHVAAWARVPITLFRLKLKLFECRGFWILLFFIAFDVLFTVLPSEDGVAHWAHLGGFIAGAALAMALLAARAVNSRGNDLLSVALGRFAWPLIGKPAQWVGEGRDEGWLQRARFVPDGVWNEVASTLGRQRGNAVRPGATKRLLHPPPTHPQVPPGRRP